MPRCRFAVYLIHFEQPYKHAKHYLGATTLGVAARLAKHDSEQGARLLQVVRAVGIRYDVVRVWRCKSREEAFALEKRLKNHSSTRECPCCTPTKRRYLVKGRA
jgi:predicted GIY-YIG superfamily endonuclease